MLRPANTPVFSMMAVLLALGTATLNAQYDGPYMAPASLPDTTAGAGYNQTLSIAQGYCSAYNWSIYSGALPPGLTLNTALSATTTISGTAGTPTQDAYTFEVAAERGQCEFSTSRSYTIRVLAIKNPTAPLPSGLVGQGYSQTFEAWGLDPGAGPAWSATGLPPGLLMSLSGQIYGTPTTAGTYPGTVSVLSGGRTATRPISIVIGSPLSFLTPATLPPAKVGVPYSVTVQTSGGTAPVTLSGGGTILAPGLIFNASTRVISGTPTTAGSYALPIYASDALLQYASRLFSVAVTYSPGNIVSTALPAGTVNVPYTATVTSTDFGIPPTWSATGLPAGLTLNPSTGVISGLPTASGAFYAVVSASTPYQTAPPRTFLISINLPPLDFTPALLPAALVGSRYSTAFSATGGDGRFSFSTTGAGVPPGLALSAAGAFSGIPTRAGDYRFVVAVTSGGVVTEKVISLTVEPPALSSSGVVLPPAYLGEPFSQVIPASGGFEPYVFQFGPGSSVPPGLTLTPTGTLAGTPTTAGNFPFSIVIMDARQRRVQQDYNLVVFTPGSISNSAIPEATQGEPYTLDFETIGGAAPLTFSSSGGALPPGLVLSPSGRISGTPSVPGSFPVTIVVTDANQRHTTRQITFAVIGALTLTPDSLPATALRRAYSATVTAAGGRPPYVFRISNGSLPEGITFSGGVFSGAATRSGTATFDVTVTDQRERSATRRYSIVVSEPPSIQVEGTLPDGVAGTAYAARFLAQGGTAPFRWSSTGQLPTGLSLGASDGRLTGVPSAAGTFTFTIQLQDAEGLSASGDFRIRIVLPPLPTPAITGVVGASGPNNQLTVGLTTTAPFPVALEGTLDLTFRPDTGADDPAVSFSNGLRRLQFTVPAGSTVAVFGAARSVQTGTVAGLITLTANFTANGVNVTPSPAPTATIRIDPAAPVITQMTAVRTPGGFSLTITGFSTPRQVTQARVTLTPASGFTLAATQFTLDVGALFSTYYSTAASVPFGSQFRLVLPFTLNDALAVSAVSVTLVNPIGSSAAANATF